MDANQVIDQLIQKIAPNLTEKEKKVTHDVLHKNLAEGKPLFEAMNVSKDYLEFAYSQVYQMFNAGKFEQANRMFQFLFLLNSQDPRYSFGIASTYQMLKDYPQAIVWYIVAATLDPLSPMPYFHLSDCYLKTGLKFAAIATLKKALEIAESEPKYAQLKNRIELNIQSIEAERSKEQAKL